MKNKIKILEMKWLKKQIKKYKYMIKEAEKIGLKVSFVKLKDKPKDKD